MAVEINIPKPIIDYNDLDNKPTLVTAHSELNLDDGTNPHGTTASDVGALPYSGATGNVDLGEFGLDAGFIEFDTTPTDTPTTQGTLSWDVDDETLQLVMNGSIMKIGEDQYYPVKNQTGNNIPKGTAVRFAGTVGSSGRLLIAPYIADGSVPNSVFMGVTSEAIADGEDGKVMWFGRVRGINTNAFNDGDVLYASPTVAGGFTTVANDKVQVCAVINKSINNGVIFVRPQIFPTTAEIGSVTDKRFVTDAQLTVIGNTSGTNTGDETQSSILTKLGASNWIDYSSLSTIVGWSSFTTTNIFYKYLSNDLIMVIFSISGTSNSTALTFTIPNTVLTGIGNINLGHFSCINNGVYRWVDFTGNGGSNVITATPTSTNIPTPGTWATSGTKSVNGTLLIPIQ
jgi:hypothetical protein